MPTKDKPEQLAVAQVSLIRQHLKEILSSRAFLSSKRAQKFLKMLVDHALAGRFDDLHERMIGTKMFGRPIDYDTANDSIVRVNATEVRKRLAQFYRELEKEPDIRIELPTGTYIPRFSFKQTIEPEHSPDRAAAVDRVQPAGIEHTAGEEIAQKSGEKELEKGNKSDPAQAESRLPTTWERFRIHSRAATGLLGVALLIVLIVVGIHSRRGVTAAEAVPSILILPLDNLSGDPTQDYFADGMTEALIADLGQVPALRTISRTSAISYKNTHKTLPEIARELPVQWVVEGSVLRQANEVRITVKLIDAKTDHPVWTDTYIRDITDVLKLQGELALAIADKIRVEVAPQTKERFAQERPVSKEAQEFYLQGMLCLNAGQFENAVNFNAGQFQNAINFFQKAIAADPNFAQPHAGLAEAYYRLGEGASVEYKWAFSQQKAEALQAIRLNDSLAEGHAELADAAMLGFDWTTAGKEFRRALDLNPGSVSIRLRHAMYLLKIGNSSSAIAEVELCRKLDPFSKRLRKEAEYIYYFSRKYDQALALHNDGLKQGYPSNSFLLGLLYLQQGMYEKAIAQFRTGNTSNSLGYIGNSYARAGQINAANEAIERLKDQVRKDGVGTFEIALVYAGLGKKDEAFAWLGKSFELRDKGLTFLKIHPCLDPLRSDRRFIDLQRRVGLPV